MSASQSKLSDPKYGYDMVVATTQVAINATMQQWLAQYDGKPYLQAYLWNEKEQRPDITDFQKLKSELGFDPFDLKNGTGTDDPKVSKLKEKMFMFAFEVEMGIPDFEAEAIPNIIEFDKEGSYVTYNMFFRKFRIISINQPVYGKGRWVNLNQESERRPWVFKFLVDLDLRTENIHNHMHKLPEETQKEIKNLGENMFSMEQLFLDLNNAGLSEPPKIKDGNKDMDTNDPAYFYLTNMFVQTYIAEIGKTGGVALGFSVVSKTPFPKQTSLIPTDMNFQICAYKDEAGKDTKDYGAYTLNYLIMAKNNIMPAPVKFDWNWVEKEKTSQTAGVMSVNRTQFVTFLNHLLSPNLHYISRIPKVKFHCNCISATFTWNFEQNTTAKTFNVVQNGGAHVLTYSHSKSDYSSDSTFCGIYGTWGNFKSIYSVQSDVFLEGTTIRIETTVTVFMHMNSMSAVGEGNFAKYRANSIYEIGVDAYGALTVRLTNEKDAVKDISDKISTSGWSDFISFGAMQGLVDRVKDKVKPMAEKIVTNDSRLIEQMLNGSRSWVFPGGKTFVFKQALFSNFQDLTANVLYLEPNTPKEEIKRLLQAAKADDARIDATIVASKNLTPVLV